MESLARLHTIQFSTQLSRASQVRVDQIWLDLGQVEDLGLPKREKGGLTIPLVSKHIGQENKGFQSNVTVVFRSSGNHRLQD
jgi:hypothetical protein